MADEKVSQLLTAQALTGADILLIVQEVSGSLQSRKVTVQELQDFIGDADIPDRTGVSPLSSSGGTVTVDWSLGDYFKLALTENVTGWSFINTPGIGKGFTIMIEITQDSVSRTVAKPGTTPGGDALDVSTAAGAVDVLAITSFDNGATLRSNLAKAYE